MNTELMFSSKTDLWSTPQDFFNDLNAEFGFTTDVCATAENAKCEHFYTAEQDGLKQDWRGVCWMNPPYGREMPKWIRKAYDSSLSLARLLYASFLPEQTQGFGTIIA